MNLDNQPVGELHKRRLQQVLRHLAEEPVVFLHTYNGGSHLELAFSSYRVRDILFDDDPHRLGYALLNEAGDEIFADDSFDEACVAALAQVVRDRLGY